MPPERFGLGMVMDGGARDADGGNSQIAFFVLGIHGCVVARQWGIDSSLGGSKGLARVCASISVNEAPGVLLKFAQAELTSPCLMTSTTGRLEFRHRGLHPKQMAVRICKCHDVHANIEVTAASGSNGFCDNFIQGVRRANQSEELVSRFGFAGILGELAGSCRWWFHARRKVLTKVGVDVS